MPSAILCPLQDNWNDRRAGRALRRAAAAVCAVLSLVLAACSGGSSGGDPPPSTPPPPPPPATSPGTLSLSAAAYDVDESSTTASFMVTRTDGSDGEVSVDITASADSATAGVDFATITTTATFTDGDTTAKTGTVGIFDDNDEEPDETIMLTLSNVTGGASIGAQDTAVITIRDDDAPDPPPGVAGRHLNDSGVTACVDGTGSEFDCASGSGGIDDYPGQDGSVGRDVIDNDDADGRAGFSFVKLDSAGVPLPDQGADYATAPWDCVRDNVTGLVWEVKTDDGGVRGRDWLYTWYEAGEPFGSEDSRTENSGECADAGHCDTAGYTAAVNAGGLCGFDDWRLPSRHELISLVDFGTPASAAIDTGYFPHVATAPYWTASTGPGTSLVKFVEFNEGLSLGAPRDETFRIRLVRGGF